jgi:hypothetical protein
MPTKIKILSQTLVALVALIALVVIVLAALKVGAIAVVLPAAAGGLAPAILAIATLVSSIGETPSRKGNLRKSASRSDTQSRT